MAIMVCEVKDEEKKDYVHLCVNKVFAVLGIYEECQRSENYEGYYVYLRRIITEFDGIYSLYGFDYYAQIVGILEGMYNNKSLNHSNVKSLTFHCISLLNSLR